MAHVTSTARTLTTGFLASAARFPERPALEISGLTLTFAALAGRAKAVAATICHEQPSGAPRLAAVFAYRTPEAYMGVLGALLAGYGYVPLNRRFPSYRTRLMLQRSGCRVIVVDRESAEQLDEVLADLASPMTLIFPDVAPAELANRWPGHRVIGARGLEPPTAWTPAEASPEDLAYLLFTSGSTGHPKGVMVSRGNVIAFVDAVLERYDVGPEDRFSQNFDMTFDLSVFDMFVAWERGACVCCPGIKQLIKPDGFIRDARLSVWFSVPSVGMLMHRMGLLRPGRFPLLRWSLFCGEPLTARVASAWASAAPASTVENLYGPTEVTVACTAYRWDDVRSLQQAARGLVPIGQPLARMKALVVDEDLREVPPGHQGELLMTGSQVSRGYWNDQTRTDAAFVRPPARDELHYRTGDLVRRPCGDEPIIYIGRRDTQIKVLGHRVELGEIEAVLREAAGTDAVIAVGWPRTDAGAGGIVAFVGDLSVDAAGVRAEAAKRLPDYMVPRTIHVKAALPLNANGKFDRRTLEVELEDSG